ncbi:MAG: hypothetical protein QM770_02820 [Tepidisphaeraceae bacterium]
MRLKTASASPSASIAQDERVFTRDRRFRITLGHQLLRDVLFEVRVLVDHRQQEQRRLLLQIGPRGRAAFDFRPQRQHAILQHLVDEFGGLGVIGVGGGVLLRPGR